MQDPDLRTQSVRPRPSRSLVSGLAAVVLLAGGGLAWWVQRMNQSPHTAPAATASPAVSPAVSPTDITQVPLQQTVQVYWLKPTSTSFALVPAAVSVSAPGQPDALLQAALEAMLNGSTTAEFTSTVPQGTKLKQLEVKPDGVHVDLSSSFTTGGGSSSMTGRLGQVIYTATTLDPQASVWLSVEGKPLTVLGGEGLVIDQPMTRTTFQKNFPL